MSNTPKPCPATNPGKVRMPAEEDLRWNKASRLAVAGHIAPSLRTAAPETKARRVALVDADGNVTAYTTLADVQRALLARDKIEFDVDAGVRPERLVCPECGGPIVAKRRGKEQFRCDGCKHPACISCGAHARSIKPRGTRKSYRCWKCLSAERRAMAHGPTFSVCVDCGKPKARSCSPRCHPCGMSKGWAADHRCEGCGKKMTRRRGGRCMCLPCARKAMRKPLPQCSGCGSEISRGALCPSAVAKRKGAPQRCRACRYEATENAK